MSLLLVRHAITDGHIQHWVLGRMPGVPLNAKGRAQAERLADYLAGVRLDLIVSSPVDRARETAEIVARRQRAEVVLDERFSEVDMGEWTGLATEEVRHRYPDELAAWRSDLASVAPPGGESLADVARRMRAGADALVTAHPEANILIVSHKDPIRALICSALDLPLHSIRRFDIDMASLSRLDWKDDQYVLRCLNVRPGQL
jgi:broad specificity phosphatase PhoE